MHATNIHILDSDGHEVCIDVRVTAVPLDRPVGQALKEAERTKRAEYGLLPCPTMDCHDVIRPFVLKQVGSPRDQASVLGTCFLRLRAGRYSLTGQTTWLSAHPQAEAEFWPPIGCLLCKCTWLWSAYCASAHGLHFWSARNMKLSLHVA